MPSAAVIDVRVIPRAPRTRVDGTRGGAILIRLAAPPVDGAANAELVRFLAELLGVARSAVEIVSGETGRRKVVRVQGVTVADAGARLGLG